MTRLDQLLQRRRFLKTLASTSTPIIIPAAALGSRMRHAPSDRISVGVVGLGGRGFALLNDLLRQPDVQVSAVCDVDEHHHRDRPWGAGAALGRLPAKSKVEQRYKTRGLYVTEDYRELCSRNDLDAVVVATPAQWPALCTLAALKAGKDVYCEKPITHTFLEGQLVYQEVKKRDAVFQTGSQQRSDARFRRAVELVRNGHLGKIERIEVGLPTGYSKPMGNSSVLRIPKHLNYDFWCGPAPLLPYMRARHHRWWRGHSAFGGGVLMDWIGHHNDIAHWALGIDKSGPTSVQAVDWKFPDTDVYDTPQQYEIRCSYEGGTVGSIATRHTSGTKIVGEEGWVYVNRGKLQASDSEWIKSSFDPGKVKVYASNNHLRNFLDCIKSRQACIAPAETAHRSITPGHLGYLSQKLGRTIKWNPKTETCFDDTEAQQLLQKQTYRKPWA